MVKAPISYDELRHIREVAAERADCLSYFESCADLGISPEFPELSERGEAESLVAEQGLAKVIKQVDPRFLPKPIRSRRGNKSYGGFNVDLRRVDFEKLRKTVEAGNYSASVYNDYNSKKQLLKDCGLETLNGENGTSISIDSLPVNALGSLFHDYYERSVRYHREGRSRVA